MADAVGQIVSGNSATDSHVIRFFRHGVQAGDDVSQAFTVGQLGERRDAKVVGAFECLAVVIPTITVDTGLEASPRNAVHDLCEDEYSLVAVVERDIENSIVPKDVRGFRPLESVDGVGEFAVLTARPKFAVPEIDAAQIPCCNDIAGRVPDERFR